MTKLAETLNEVRADQGVVKSHWKPKPRLRREERSASQIDKRHDVKLGGKQKKKKKRRNPVLVHLGASFSPVTQCGPRHVHQKQLTNIMRESGQQPPGGGLIMAGRQQSVSHYCTPALRTA